MIYTYDEAYHDIIWGRTMTDRDKKLAICDIWDDKYRDEVDREKYPDGSHFDDEVYYNGGMPYWTDKYSQEWADTLCYLDRIQ